MTAHFLVAGLLAACASLAFPADLCPPASTNHEWSTYCFEGDGDTRRIKPAFLKQLRVNRDGMATILIAEPRELVAVNRDGRVVIPGIRYTGDFDYPNAQRGIGRFYTSRTDPFGKPVEQCGYFQSSRLHIIAPAQFDHCQPFKEEKALACTGCVPYCTETDCQNSVYIGGQGIVLGRDGKSQSRFPLPTLETVCGRPELVRISELDSSAHMLKCLSGARDPFNDLRD